MKKSAIVAVVIIIILAVGGYFVFHKSKTPTTNNTNTTSSTSSTNSVIVTATNSSLGSYLTDTSGNTLYTYSGDGKDVSNCTGTCLSNWPAYVDKGSTTNLPSGIGTITRKDNGDVQYTYNGLPLYYFASDTKGKVTGNGVSGFSIVKPSTASSTSSTSNNPY